MHNCKLTRSILIDHTLGETSATQPSEVLAGLDQCPACQAEYASLRNTLRVSRQALQSAVPAEEFWPGYHARLKEKLTQHRREDAEPYALSFPPRLPFSSRLRNGLWKCAAASVRVPVPAALAILLLVGVLSFKVRSIGQESPRVTQSIPVANHETRTIEVPVIKERVVTRVVYVEKKSRRSDGFGSEGRADQTAADIRSRTGGSGKTAMSLAGFKPTDQLKLTVIKGSYQDEK